MEQTKIKLSSIVISYGIFQNICEQNNVEVMSVEEFNRELGECKTEMDLYSLMSSTLLSFVYLLTENIHDNIDVLLDNFQYSVDELYKIENAIENNYESFVKLLIQSNGLKTIDSNKFNIPEMAYTEYYNRLIENKQVLKRLIEYGAKVKELITDRLWIVTNLSLLGAGLNGVVYLIEGTNYTFKITGNYDEFIAAGKIMKLQQLNSLDYNHVNTIYEVFTNNTNSINPLLDIIEPSILPLQSYTIISDYLIPMEENNLMTYYDNNIEMAESLNVVVGLLKEKGFVDLPHIEFQENGLIDWNSSYINNILTSPSGEIKIHDIMFSTDGDTIGAFESNEQRRNSIEEIRNSLDIDSDISTLSNMLSNTKVTMDYQEIYNETIQTYNEIDKNLFDPYFHCSPANFEKFDSQYMGSNIGFDNGGYGFYLTKDLHQALEYGNNVYHVEFNPIGTELSSLNDELTVEEWKEIVSKFTELFAFELSIDCCDNEISDSMLYDILLFDSSVMELIETKDSYTDLLLITNMINIIYDVFVNNGFIEFDNTKIVPTMYKALYEVTNKCYTTIIHNDNVENVVLFYEPEILNINVF